MKLSGFSILFFLFLLSCSSDKQLLRQEEGKELDIDSLRAGKELSSRDSTKLLNYLHEANKEKMIGNQERAQEIFEKVLDLDPSVAVAHYEIARIQRDKKERSKALKRARYAAELAPENRWYRKFLAELYMEYGSYEKAAGIFRELREKDDRDIQLAYQHADALIRAGKYEEAVGVYDSIEKRMGARPKLLLQKNRLYQRIGKKEKALEEIEHLIETQPGKSEYYGIKAELHQQMGEKDKALETYEELLEMDPDNGKAHLSLSRFHRQNGNEEKAIEHLQKAYRSQSLEVDKKVKVLLNFYSLSEQDPDLKEEAYGLLDILVEAHPNEAKVYTVYGDFLSRDEKDMKARRMFRKAVSLDPDRFPIWQQILLLDQRNGMLDSLIADSREAKEYFPNQPRIHLFEGNGLMQQERYEEAIEVLETGKGLVVENEDLEYRFLERLGEAYYRNGAYDASDRSFEKALEIRDDDPFLLNNYAYYLSTRGDSLSKALKMSEKANELEPGRPSFIDTHGWILYQKDEFKKARERLNEALERGGGNSSTILEHYGDALFRTGKEEKALEYWKKARKAGAGSEELDRKIREKELPTP